MQQEQVAAMHTFVTLPLNLLQARQAPEAQ
jgi:hypothetical protein